MNRSHTFSLALALMLSACTPSLTLEDQAQMPSSEAEASSAMSSSSSSTPKKSASSSEAVKKDVSSSSASKKWSADLTEDQIAVLRDGGTETPFTSPLVDEHRKGTFVSADCGEPVFRSEQKFDSGTGWPSFWSPIAPDAVIEDTDTTAGMTRTEIRSKCGGHLGHVFNDGPQPTGLRYCINGLALKFIPDAEQ